MAIAGTSSARQFCRNTKITRMTRMIASNSVFATSSTDSLMKLVRVVGVGVAGCRRGSCSTARSTSALTSFGGLQRVGARRERDGDARRRDGR